VQTSSNNISKYSPQGQAPLWIFFRRRDRNSFHILEHSNFDILIILAGNDVVGECVLVMARATLAGTDSAVRSIYFFQARLSTFPSEVCRAERRTEARMGWKFKDFSFEYSQNAPEGENKL
jgi:hypothetical protein